MKEESFSFSRATVAYYSEVGFSALRQLVPQEQCVLLTDENVYQAHAAKFADWKHILIPAGEQHKQQRTVDHIIARLMQLEADRQTLLIGVGGGVVTDITGYTASIYMRGIDCAYVPTTLLNLVDASIGGKTGVDVGAYKNIVGSFRHPRFILQDLDFLTTLPHTEWINGFAEIIKHACIRDKALFKHLSQHRPEDFMQNKELLAALIHNNIRHKFAVVQADEFEKAERKLLNFGHSIGHAIENLCALPHGRAVAVGMMAAAFISEKEVGFVETEALRRLLQQYQLPVSVSFEPGEVFQLLKLDKKRMQQSINFVLLRSIGDAFIQPIGLDRLHSYLQLWHNK